MYERQGLILDFMLRFCIDDPGHQFHRPGVSEREACTGVSVAGKMFLEHARELLSLPENSLYVSFISRCRSGHRTGHRGDR